MRIFALIMVASLSACAGQIDMSPEAVACRAKHPSGFLPMYSKERGCTVEINQYLDTHI